MLQDASPAPHSENATSENVVMLLKLAIKSWQARVNIIWQRLVFRRPERQEKGADVDVVAHSLWAGAAWGRHYPDKL